jgi:hypothetical protein
MAGNDFILGYLPFWIVNYALAIVVWSCVGRFLLGFFMPSVQPNNYIWRAFVALTDWPVRLVGLITPSIVWPGWLPLVTAIWVYYLRIAAFVAFASAGMVPRLGPGG